MKKLNEWISAEAKAGRIHEFTVHHPQYGVMRTPAFGVTDAKLQAAEHWGVGYEEWARMRVALDLSRINGDSRPQAAEQTVMEGTK